MQSLSLGLCLVLVLCSFSVNQLVVAGFKVVIRASVIHDDTATVNVSWQSTSGVYYWGRLLVAD
jgi:hypothetical protein